jgi:hypothetical protein
MVAKLILLCSLKEISLLKFGNIIVREQGLFFIFSGRHLSTHCFQYLRHFCVYFFFSFFKLLHSPMSLFYNKTLREISTKTWSIYFEWKPNEHVFVFTPSVEVEYFWVDLNRRHVFCAYLQCRSSAYLGVVYMILILKTWQASYKDQQNLTKLNIYASSK